MTIFDYIAGAIAIIGLLFIGYHHFFIKPKQLKRQMELDLLFDRNINAVSKYLNKEK